MSVVLTQEMPGATRELVEQVTAELHLERGLPTGLIAHTAIETGDGIRIIDIWESAEDYARFEHDQLGPAMALVAQRNGMDLDALPTPTHSFAPAFDVVLP